MTDYTIRVTFRPEVREAVARGDGCFLRKLSSLKLAFERIEVVSAEAESVPALTGDDATGSEPQEGAPDD